MIGRRFKLYICILLFVFVYTTKAQSIKAIRNNYYAIQNNLDSYTMDKRTICESPDKYWTCTNFTVYLDNGKIVKLVTDAGEEGCWGITEYFYKNEKLFFVFSENGNERDEPVKIDELRIYVDNGVIVQALCRSGTAETIAQMENRSCPKDDKNLQMVIKYYIKSSEIEKEEYWNDVKNKKDK